ncbi:hypothetical protein HRI96_00955 [Treponema parvum]|uniref:Polymorphic outer membrane protein n=1 Tax=Treponema parvum TaxID=138851 RepID=A0A975EYD0_9SPIR|nr:hypothetical protein [Treponema parvum]QTQ10885.1 hypothetical protein HRI96_00955 [Treponema parvum]
MRKFITIMIGAASLAALLTITACKELFADIEEDFSYWASEPVITGFRSASPVPTSAAGVQCVPSASPAVLTFTVRNPQSFSFVMPGTGAPSDIITFGSGIHDASGTNPPAVNADYTLVQSARDTLTLTYTSAFLQRYEYGAGNIGAAIKLYSTDGRKFNQIYKFDLYANTAPVLEYAGIGKTQVGSEWFYVLLFRAKDMGTMIGSPGESIHKDINTMNVTAGGVSLSPITLSVTGTEFTSSSADLLATASPLDAAHPLPTGSGLLRLKTDVKVGGPEKVYDVSIKDEQGLSSAVIRASTQRSKLADVALLDGSTPITGTSESNLEEFSGISGKTLTATATAAPAGTTITGSIAKFDGSTWTQISGGTVSGTTTAVINLPALGTGIYEERYKITLKAQLSGYDDSDPKEFFIKLVRYEVPGLKIKQDFSSSDNSLYCISAGTKGYVTEDIIPDEGQYNSSSNPLVIYSMLNQGCKLELSADAGATVKYKLNSGAEQSAPASAEITLSGGAHTLEVWTVRGAIEGPHTTVHIKVVDAVSSYGELKNVVQNTPEQGTGPGQHDYNTFFINIKIGANLTADTEIAVTGGKRLMLSSSSSGTVHTVDANNSRRIFKVSGTGTGLILENIKLEGGYAADGKGGAVYVEAGGTLGLTEKTVITPSTAPDTNTKGKNDVYLANGTLIKVDGALTSANPIVARITPEQYTDGIALLHGGNLLNTYTKFSVTQPADAANLWKIKSDGTLQAIPTIINGGSGSGAWQRLKEAVQALPEGSTITVNGTITATNDSGDDDRGVIDIDKNLTIKGKTGASSDILNADRVSLGSNAHRIFTVQSGKTLTLENLALKNGKAGGLSEAGYGGAIYTKGGTVTMKNCTVTGNQAKIGGAVYAEADGSTPAIVKVSGGTIGGDTTMAQNLSYLGGGGKGGGVYIKGTGSSLTLSDNASITGNRASNGEGGGVYVGSGATFMLESGAITNCTGNQKSGAGVYVETGAVFKMKGSSCVTPTAADNDVYLANNCKIELVGSLTSTAPVARITVPDANYAATTQVLDGAISNGTPANYTKFTVTPQTSPAKKWIIDEHGKLAEVIGGGSASNPTAKWTALKNAVESASDGDVFYIEGEYTMSAGSDTMVPAANCTIRGTNNAVLNADNKGKMITITAPGIENMTLENLTIKNGKDDEFALSAYRFFKFHLKNVTVKDTEKIIKSDSGDVTFENVQALDNNSMIELGGFDTQQGGSDYHYSYLNVKGDTEIKGTVKLVFPMHTDHFNGAIKICDKKSYTLKLDFKNDSNNYYNSAENQQVVFLDNSVTGFSLTQAVRNIAVKPDGGNTYRIDNSGYLRRP